MVGGDVSKRTVDGTIYLVRAVRAGGSTKDYRCPGCHQLVRSGTAHVVAWPETPPLGSQSGIEVRRHWHTFCWERN
jgi:hypothetical protein